MSPRIEPALSAEEWAYWRREGIVYSIGIACDAISYDLHQDPAKLLAIANAALPDSDDRKITPEMVRRLRIDARAFGSVAATHPAGGAQRSYTEDQARFFDALADALESYLPPEPDPVRMRLLADGRYAQPPE